MCVWEDATNTLQSVSPEYPTPRIWYKQTSLRDVFSTLLSVSLSPDGTRSLVFSILQRALFLLLLPTYVLTNMWYNEFSPSTLSLKRFVLFCFCLCFFGSLRNVSTVPTPSWSDRLRYLKLERPCFIALFISTCSTLFNHSRYIP